MTIALILFGAAAAGGLLLAGLRFTGRPYPPLFLALAHGALAVAGLIALIAGMGSVAGDRPKVALVLFVLAAAGGLGLFFHHLRHIALPKWLVVVHALVAVGAFLLLLSAVL